MQSFLASTGVFGVGMYTFLERLMIPFGLHHFIYAPFLYDSAIVDGGIKAYWVAHLSEFASMKVLLQQCSRQEDSLLQV